MTAAWMLVRADLCDGEVAVSAVDRDGGVRRLAAWPATADDDFAASWSPDGAHVAVLAGGELSVVSAVDGAVASAGTLSPPPEPDGPPFHSTEPVIVWQPSGAPLVLRPGLEGPSLIPLQDGWEVRLHGAVEVDGGHTGHGSSWMGLMSEPGTSAEAMRAERARLDEREALVASRPIAFGLTAVRNGVEIPVHEERRAPAEGVTKLHWPPIVGPRGVLLRRSVETMDRQAGGRIRSDIEMQHPWLVTPAGAVRTLPFELGVSPLATLPDGRFLLPGADALWRDGRDEPLHALADGGRLEPVRLDGDPVSASAMLAAVAEDLLPAEPPEIPEDALWGFEAARVDAETGELVLLLAEDFEIADGVRWVVLTIALAGSGAPRLVARGEAPAGSRTVVVL